MKPNPSSSSVPRSAGVAGRGRLLVAGVVAWFGLSGLAAVHTMIRARVTGQEPLAGLDAYVRQLSFWVPLALVAVAVWFFVRRWPLDRRHPLRSGLQHGLAACGALVALISLAALASLWLRGQGFSWRGLAHEVELHLLLSFHLWFFCVVALMASAQALELLWSQRRRERQSLLLRESLWEARLSNLEAQLRPHFLFNALHSISSLVDEDPDRARDVIVALGDLLRFSLRRPADHEVTLGDELAGLDLYLAIERVRFQDRLEFERSVEPSALRALVPQLLLQPLVENAIRHGVAQHPGAGRISLSAAVRDSRVEIRIANDGSLPVAGHSEGIGLGNTRQRLDFLYGAAATLSLAARSPRGAEVLVTLPFREKGSQ
ncbi:MAG: histidine kinase [Acidobacteriota bacterium]